MTITMMSFRSNRISRMVAGRDWTEAWFDAAGHFSGSAEWVGRAFLSNSKLHSSSVSHASFPDISCSGHRRLPFIDDCLSPNCSQKTEKLNYRTKRNLQ